MFKICFYALQTLGLYFLISETIKEPSAFNIILTGICFVFQTLNTFEIARQIENYDFLLKYPDFRKILNEKKPE